MYLSARCAVQPGLRRPMAESHQLVRFRARLFRSEHKGTATSNRLPTSTPKNCGGVTPITGNQQGEGCPRILDIRQCLGRGTALKARVMFELGHEGVDGSLTRKGGGASVPEGDLEQDHLFVTGRFPAEAA